MSPASNRNLPKVLVIDDDPENLDLLKEMLQTEYQVVVAQSGSAGLDLIRAEKPDVIILDVNMPGMDGFETCKRIREQDKTGLTPVIMVTTASALEKKIHGFGAGADDYLTKPFHVTELLARVNAQMRRSKVHAGVVQSIHEEFRFGKFKMVPKLALVSVDDRVVKLTQVETDLLKFFFNRPDQMFTRAKILEELWPGAQVTERTVDTHLANIRKKLGDYDLPIVTVYGSGYIFRKSVAERMTA